MKKQTVIFIKSLLHNNNMDAALKMYIENKLNSIVRDWYFCNLETASCVFPTECQCMSVSHIMR